MGTRGPKAYSLVYGYSKGETIRPVKVKGLVFATPDRAERLASEAREIAAERAERSARRTDRKPARGKRPADRKPARRTTAKQIAALKAKLRELTRDAA